MKLTWAGLSGSSWSVSHGFTQPSIQVLPTVCYLQGWMQDPRGLDQMGDGLP
jgi:hypothetical protein